MVLDPETLRWRQINLQVSLWLWRLSFSTNYPTTTMKTAQPAEGFASSIVEWPTYSSVVIAAVARRQTSVVVGGTASPKSVQTRVNKWLPLDIQPQLTYMHAYVYTEEKQILLAGESPDRCVSLVMHFSECHGSLAVIATYKSLTTGLVGFITWPSSL